VLDGPGAVFHSDLRATGREPFPLGMGKMGLQSQRKVVYPANFPDGMSNTFLIVEAADPIEWSRPGDLKYDPNGPLPRFSNRWSGGFQASLADGSVRFIPTKTAEPTLRAFITPAGGEPIPPDAP
ncbi:MAG TPA: H-X9-DG-CTERM domain-containing protein, partial [Gemmataceae bacterium]|nr:H-X9-DG-CTERM domain-containing protein [Gemmataceae bacterium]